MRFPGPIRGMAAPMIRRISTKFLIAVLAAVIVPFLGFAIFVDTQMAGRLSKDVVLYSLKGLSADLALRVDRDIEEFNATVELQAVDPGCLSALDEARREEAGELESDPPDLRRALRDSLSGQFNNLVLAKRDFDLLLLVDEHGSFVACNTKGRSTYGLSLEVLDALKTRSYAHEAWFEAAALGTRLPPHKHTSDLLPARNAEPGVHPENFHIAFAAPVVWPADEKRADVAGKFVGALYVLVNWKRIQDEVDSPVLKEYFQGLVGPDEFPSAYGWIWDRDCDTIIAHQRPELYGERVSGAKIGLPQMVEAAKAADWGLYPEYEFAGRRKNAAFKHTSEGWVVGVGIDNDDIFRGVRELRELLFKATLVVLLFAVLWTLVIARRTTQPILALREQVQKVAAGDLSARAEVRSGDELGELAQALNTMTAEIALSREKLVRAEKEAAWREMARQVAHDIKNPLTPILLSVELCKRAKDEGHPNFDALFERTVEIVQRQVAHLREIASDFHALTGARPENKARVDVGDMLDQVLALNAAYAQTLGVKVESGGAGGEVMADPALLRRVLLNLVSNALEAMPEGGELACTVEARGAQLAIEIRDTGAGLPAEVRERLFEPYFTTRTKGTGLGLAIAKRVVEDHAGSIELVNVEPGPGTLARVLLPLAPVA